ncbi:MAG: MbnP family protein [Opitutaceae bacterium]
MIFLFAVPGLANGFDLELNIRHTVSGKPLILDSIRYTNSSNETFSVSRLSYILSEFELQNTDGDWIVAPETFGFLDATKRRDHINLPGIQAQNYRALRFSIGLAPTVNHSDPAQYAADHALNPNLNNLHWDWKTGYIFLAIEGRYRKTDQSLAGFVYHFANDPQRTRITIGLPHDVSDNSRLEIDFDLAALLNSPAPISFVKDGASSHSREGDSIATKLKANLQTAFQLKRIISRRAPEAIAPVTPIDLPASYTPYPFKMSARFPIPDLPRDNPLIVERVELGKKLFHDPILSRGSEVSCASCHKESIALSDNRVKSEGIDGRRTRRHSMPIFNLAWKDSFFWDGRAATLREQALIPIMNPIEMGGKLPNVIRRIKADEDYVEAFAKAFGSGKITPKSLSLALESFLLSQTSYDSKFDQAMAGKATLTTEEQRGLELFMTEFEPRSRQYGADCFHCHGGALFTDNRLHDNGLPEIARDRGLAEHTGKASDEFKFSTPSLRNVAITAPYMHDGRFATLEEVVDHYSSGIEGRSTLDPNLAKHPKGGLPLSDDDKAALVAFLKTLTDPKWNP